MGKVKEKVNGKQATANKTEYVFRDLLGISVAIAFLAFFLQKAQLSCDWDTLESILKMNAAGYSPLTNPPSHYHLLVEPLVYVLTTLASPLLGPDHMNGYILMTSIFAGGLLALTYYTVHQVTSNRGAAWLSTAFIGVSFNFFFLTLTVEDNIINQFFNLLAIFLAFALLGIVKTRLDHRGIAVLLGISICLAVGTNLRSMYLLTLLPLLVFLSSDRVEGLKKALLVLGSTSVAVVSMVIVSLVLVKKAVSPGNFIEFFSVHYYSDPTLWYFANPAHSLGMELVLASRGFTRSLIGDYLWTTLNGAGEWLFVMVAVVLLAVFAAVLNRQRREPAIIILATLFVINTVNSFFYEPVSLERWDHAVLLLGIAAGLVWSSRPTGWEKYAMIAVVGIAALGTILFIPTMGNFITIAAFGYEKVPAEAFRQNHGVVVVGQDDLTEQAMYLRYLYGKDNVVFFDDSATAQDILAYMKKANGTVYYDAIIYDRCYDLEDSVGYLAGSAVVGRSELPWYVSDP